MKSSVAMASGALGSGTGHSSVSSRDRGRLPFEHGARCVGNASRGAGQGVVAEREDWMCCLRAKKRNKKVFVHPCLDTYECKTRGEEQWQWPPRGEVDAQTRHSCHAKMGSRAPS